MIVTLSEVFIYREFVVKLNIVTDYTVIFVTALLLFCWAIMAGLNIFSTQYK